jgi:CobQ-like glutamine amidotransferase family enzyme
MTTARLLQLYPEELGVAGDRGNLLALTRRLAAAGIESEIVRHRRGDILPESADLVLIGNGPLSAMRNILDDLLANADTLRTWVDAGTPVFAYGSGAELLGARIDLLDGSSIDGLGIFPFSTERVATRTVGYVIVESDWGRLVGFEDNASRWILDDSATPLGRVVTGDGNGDGREGVVTGGSIATQIGGPVLPLNPVLCAVLVASVSARTGVNATGGDLANVDPASADPVSADPTGAEPTGAEPTGAEPTGTEPTGAGPVGLRPAGVSELDEYAERAREVIIAHAAHVFSRI